jgi:hypothetical protein
MRRDRHASLPRIGLWLGVERGTGRQQLDPAPPDGHHASRKIDIITAQSEQFTAEVLVDVARACETPPG